MITYKAITEAVQRDPECRKGYHMVLRGSDIAHVTAAVNRGIDSRLEVCAVHGRDRYELLRGIWPIYDSELECWISAESMPVLLRRLAEANDESHLLASDILESLGFEEADPYDIVSPVDEEAHA